MRSTTQRCLPSCWLLSMPRRAMRGVMPRLRRSPGGSGRSHRPCRRGAFRAACGGVPGGGAPGGSHRPPWSAMLSWRLAPVRTRASGRSVRSTTRCRLVPGLPRSVGFGPVASPPFWREPRRHPRSPATSRYRRPGPGAAACGDGSDPIGRHPASCVAGASRSCPSIRQPRTATAPTGSTYRARGTDHSGRKQRCDLSPQRIGQQLLRHAHASAEER